MSSVDLLNNSVSCINDEQIDCTAISQAATKSSLANAPVWLTNTYFEQCLRKHYNDSHLKLNEMTVAPALGKGENYGGVLTRLKCEYVNRQGKAQCAQYIVKTSFEGDEFASRMMAPYDIFRREMNIYKHVLPKLKALLLEINDDEQIFADTFAIDFERTALIFEDLNMRGFQMPDRLQGVNMQLAKIILRKLAKMHATSAVLNEREAGCLSGYDCGMFNRHTENYAPCFLGFLEACARRVGQWPGYEHYAQKLQQLKPMFMEFGKRVFDVIPGFVNVLAHGDLWTNNVMVKYDAISKEPIDAIIIDFQYAAWGSPAIDLFYFLNTSLTEELHLHQQNALIQYYYEQLSDILLRLSFKEAIPSLHTFHVQLAHKAFYAFSSTCIILPIQRNEVTDDADFNALMQEDERAINFKNTCYTNAYCQRIIKQLLPMYERYGLLDVQQ